MLEQTVTKIIARVGDLPAETLNPRYGTSIEKILLNRRITY